MNKKILIGSILAVTVLIGVSFTSVVGYRSVESDVKASPLFNIRSSRAVEKVSKGLSNDYVGKGDYINLLIPDRHSKLELLRKAIKRIQTIDDKAFNRFVNLAVHRIKLNKEYNDMTETDMIIALYFFRENQDIVVTEYLSNNINYTWRKDFAPTICWYPLCNLFQFLDLIIMALIAIPLLIYIILSLSLTFAWTCGEDCHYPS